MLKTFKILLLLLFFILELGGGFTTSHAKILLTAETAIKNYYPDCQVTSENLFLTDQQSKELQLIYLLPVKTKLFTRRLVSCKKEVKHFIYLDTDIVRTQPQVLMVVISDKNILEKVELLSYSEPEEYIPHGKWYETFQGKNEKQLAIDKDIAHISGATLTTRSTLSIVNKILAVHQIWQKKNAK